MEDLYFNLSKEEFSKGRKILLWVISIAATAVTLFVIYLKFVMFDPNATLGLLIVLVGTTAFFYLIAILATAKRKEHFFKIDSELISYRYGLMFQKQHSYQWSDIKEVYFPPHSKKTAIILNNGKVVGINLTWIERNKSRMIRKHIFYTAKSKGLALYKTNYKK